MTPRPAAAAGRPATPALLPVFEFDGLTFPVVKMTNGDLGLPLRRLTTPINLDPDAQRKRIERSAWSQGRTAIMDVRLPGDDRVRQHFVISHRIVPMWIANITTSKIEDAEARERMERWQVELADALYDYVFHGGAINPRATDEQLAALIGRAKAQAEVLRTLDGIVDPKWLEAKARHVAARALGEEPEIDPQDRPLTVGEYLEDQGMDAAGRRKISPVFGKLLKAAYRERHGRNPGTVDRFIDGAPRPVAAYTERDRPLFDDVLAQLRQAAAAQTGTGR